jgi:hypothetical protein
METRRSGQLLWLLALPFSCMCEAQASLPATVEVDLIFPRNDTYAPSPEMPLVFAIQNSETAAALNPEFSLHIVRLDHNSSAGTSVSLRTSQANFSSSDPYFVYWDTNLFNNTEGTWSLIWDVSTRNCSKQHNIFDDLAWPGSTGQTLGNYVMFTTKSGGKPVDLVAATAESTCADTQGFTYNVTDISPYHPRHESELLNDDGTPNQRNTCAILSPTPPPPPQPCRVKIDAAAASSIVRELACRSWHGCPSSSPPRFRVTGAAWLIAAFPLVYLFL